MTDKQLSKINNDLIKAGSLVELPEKIETVEDLLDLRNRINEAFAKVKADLSDYLIKNGQKKVETEDWSISTWEETRVSCPDPKDVEKAYLKKVPMENIVFDDGGFYQLQGNTEQVKNELAIGGNLPKGFEVKTIRKTSLKVGGKTV